MNYSKQLIIGDSKNAHNKKQKEFNRLSKEIFEHQQIHTQLQKLINDYHLRSIQEYRPLIERYLNLKEDLILLLDKFYNSSAISEFDKKIILKILVEFINELLLHQENEKILKLYHIYNSSETFDREFNNKRSLAQHEPDLTTTDNTEQEGSWQENQRTSFILEEKLSAKEKLNGLNSKATLRRLYLDLLKVYHPDLEQDDTIKIFKTEKVQQITSAYLNKNFTELLQMHIDTKIDTRKYELNKISSSVLNNLNKQLHLQLDQIKEEIEQARLKLAIVCNINPIHTHNEKAIEIQFTTNLRLLKSENKYWNQIYHLISTQNYLKVFLTQFKP